MNTPISSRYRSEHGFTLTELMFTLVLIAILASLAAPSLSGYVSRTEVDRVMNMIVGDVSYTRMLAVRSGRAATLEETTAGYRIVVDQPDGTERLAKVVDVAGQHPGTTLTFPSSPATFSLTFNSRGILNSGGPVQIGVQRNGISDHVGILATGRAYHNDY